MKFEAVIGNPPYQLTKNGNNEQIHRAFLDLAFTTTSKYLSLIEPLNWLNNAKLLERLRPHVISLYRYPNSKAIFTTVQIPAGIGFSLIDKEADVTESDIYEGGELFNRPLSGNYNADDQRIKNEVHFTHSVFDRISKYSGHKNEDKTLPLNPNGELKIWFKKESGKSGKGSWYSIDRKSIPDGPIIDEWKVMISNDGHAEGTDTKAVGIFNNLAVVLPPKYITTNRPVLLEAKNKEDAVLLARYANTQFFRRLLHIEAKSNSIPLSAYKQVPDPSEFAQYYDGKEDLEEFLERFYKLSNATIKDIKKRISPKNGSVFIDGNN